MKNLVALLITSGGQLFNFRSNFMHSLSLHFFLATDSSNFLGEINHTKAIFMAK